MQLEIKAIKKEAGGVFSLLFSKPENFIFYPGQYLDIGRILSISSSPTEDFVMLTYKTGISSFKKMLEKVKIGDLFSSSHPAGTVVMDNSSPIVMIAGGIGITPHRSMIKWAVDSKADLPITLIYSNSDEDFIFKEELDSWVKQYPKLKIHYIVTSKDGHLNPDKLKSFLPPYSILHTIYYLAGPPGLVDDFENILLSLSIDETSIRTDRFDGL